MRPAASLVIGVDFDNTLVNCDLLFHRIALERGLIPKHLPTAKEAVRDYIRMAGREAEWTELQGYVYGARLIEASPFPGALDFFRQCHAHGIALRVISHKTRNPYAGAQYDLHQAAQAWLQQHGFYAFDSTGLAGAAVFFELTRAAKIQRIGACRCAIFIDDLLEVLTAPDFPAVSLRIWFAPSSHAPAQDGCVKARNWKECWALCRSIINRI